MNGAYSSTQINALSWPLKIRQKVEAKYQLHGNTVEADTSAKYLGVTYNKLQWDQHINNITSKCNKTPGTIRIKEQPFQTLVCQLVEYSYVWDPYIKTYINKIEAVQRRAAIDMWSTTTEIDPVSAKASKAKTETLRKHAKRCLVL